LKREKENEMKKIGLIAIALVTVLATLGVGFSMWSQTAVIKGFVSSGNVQLTISNPTCDMLYKDLAWPGPNDPAPGLEWNGYQAVSAGQPVFVSGIPQLDTTKPALYYAPQPTPTWNPANPNYSLIGWAAITGINNAAVGGPVVTATWNNIFPWPYILSTTGSGPTNGDDTVFTYLTADFDIVNTGTTPVILSVTAPGQVAGADVVIGTVHDNNFYPGAVVGYQLEPGGARVHVGIAIVLNETLTKGFNGSLNVQIIGTQWNESPLNTSIPH
jgi:hypothetical protein